MGYPVSHSRSPVIHRLFALQTGQNIQYELLQVAPDNLDKAIAQFQRTGGKGLNITVPHKTEVLRLTDQLSERATLAGSANTLVFQEDSVFGDNTDGIGLLRDLVSNLGLLLQGCNILILGAGGATRGIVVPLLEMRPASITIANRTLAKARDLVEQFAKFGPVTACRFGEVPKSTHFSLIINATSAGLAGENPPYPAFAIGDGCLCYDLSYGLAKVDQRVEAGHRAEHDIAALAAIAAVGSAEFDIFFTPETDGAAAARARGDVDLGLVEKMHPRPLAHRAGFCRVIPVFAQDREHLSDRDVVTGLVFEVRRARHFRADQAVADREQHESERGAVERAIVSSGGNVAHDLCDGAFDRFERIAAAR